MNTAGLQCSPEYVNDYSYLTLMGSRAYGTNNIDSDYDFYGFVVPPADIVFPHLKGEINGFGRNVQKFEQFQAQHVPHPFYREYDITVYNIVKYFQLVMEGNPNMVDSLFTPDSVVQYADEVAKMVRENRKLFLSQKMYHTFKGMLWAHLNRLKSGHTKQGRLNLAEKYGYDTKDAYHSVRMLLELKQVLYYGDLDLTKNSNYLKDVRNGEFTLEHMVNSIETQLYDLEKAVFDNPHLLAVPYKPDEDKIHSLLVNCLEEKYGNLAAFGFGKY